MHPCAGGFGGNVQPKAKSLLALPGSRTEEALEQTLDCGGRSHIAPDRGRQFECIFIPHVYTDPVTLRLI
jgi:hypothetical protein